MYKLLLIGKYLRKKLAPLFAVLAVSLCTAMVIIVISVMGGFLETMRGAAQTLTGPVTIRGDITGFSDYDTLAQRLLEDDQVLAVSPIIRSFGLLNLGGRLQTVEVLGIQPESFHAVTGYADTFYWSSQDLLEDLARDTPPGSPGSELRQRYEERLQFYRDNDIKDLAKAFESLPHMKPNQHPVVMGIEVSPWSQRNGQGGYDFGNSPWGRDITLTVVPVSRGGSLEAFGPERVSLVVTNEFKSGLYDIDANRLYVPFDLLQRLLKMHRLETQAIDPETGDLLDETVLELARTNELMVRGRPGVTLEALFERVSAIHADFLRTRPLGDFTYVETWQDRHRALLGAVEKEKFLLTVLFAIISLVAVVMIGVIFYMIVMEKTKDIGVLRAIGASRSGVVGIFLGYGLAIGVVGAGVGVGLAAAIVWNINRIQDLLSSLFGFRMWDPSIYYFDRIPSQMDPYEVAVIACCAVASSVLGSLVPALLAGRMKPVDALRFE